MRHVAKLVGGATHAPGQDLLLGRHVEQGVLDLQAATIGHDAADQHVLRSEGLPVAVDHLTGLGRLADHVLARNRFEVTGVAQVIADDVRHVFRQDVTALPAERNHGNRDGRVTTTGDHQRVGGLRCAGHQGQGEEREANQGTHRSKSSGLKTIRR